MSYLGFGQRSDDDAVDDLEVASFGVEIADRMIRAGARDPEGPQLPLRGALHDLQELLGAHQTRAGTGDQDSARLDDPARQRVEVVVAPARLGQVLDLPR